MSRMATNEEGLHHLSDSNLDDAMPSECTDADTDDDADGGESNMSSFEWDSENNRDSNSSSEENSYDSEGEEGEEGDNEDQLEGKEEEGQISSEQMFSASLNTSRDQAEASYTTICNQRQDDVVSTIKSSLDSQPEAVGVIEASATNISQVEVTDNVNIEKAEPSKSEKKCKRSRKRKAKSKTSTDGETSKKSKKDREKKEQNKDDRRRRKKASERRNIRKILPDRLLDENTKKAQEAELERKKRLVENLDRRQSSKVDTRSNHDVVTISSDENDEYEDEYTQNELSNLKPDNLGFVTIISDEDDDDDNRSVQINSSECEPKDSENSGSHTNDSMNQPDARGRVLVNVGHPPKEPDIFLPPHLAAKVKPHQIGGIRFLYDNVVESLEQYKSGTGLGCILAHSMGLGKTLQVISFSDVFLRNTSGKRVLIIVPVNTLQNWMSEFNKWHPENAKFIAQNNPEDRRKAEERVAAELQQQEGLDKDLQLKLASGVFNESIHQSHKMEAETEQIGFDATQNFNVDMLSTSSSPASMQEDQFADIQLDNIGPQLDGPVDTALSSQNDLMKIPTPRADIRVDYNCINPRVYFVNDRCSTPHDLTNNGACSHFLPATPDMNKPNLPQSYMVPYSLGDGVVNHPNAPIQGNFTPLQPIHYDSMPQSHILSIATSQQNSILPINLPPNNQISTESNSFKNEMKSSSRLSTTFETKTTVKPPKHNKVQHSLKTAKGEDMNEYGKLSFKQPKNDPSDLSEVKKEEMEPKSGFNVVSPRAFQVFLVNDAQKTNTERANIVGQWFKKGGVLLMGYEMYRLLTSKRVCTKPKKYERKNKEKKSVTIDLMEEEKNSALLSNLHEVLVNPGPDLIICDEGHRIKNNKTGISKSLKNIKTRRRVVLTGYPLQNNLRESWCMVDFVRPNFLGKMKEFSNMFEGPITNGQCRDSTPEDVRLMRGRAHVLHNKLEGFVQRRSAEVLTKALPPKAEIVLLVKMSPIQRRLYKAFIETLGDITLCAKGNANPLKAFSVCCKIWNHPDILHEIIKQRKLEENDLDIEDNDYVTGNKNKSRLKKTASTASIEVKTGMKSVNKMPGQEQDKTITYDWAEEIMATYEPEHLENGGKMLILFSIIQESIALGEKVLVFSQSLFTLSLIEKFLSKKTVPWPQGNTEMWCKNKNYFRLDGSTSSTEREKLIDAFNDEANSNIHLFLLSTKAGCLGINLIGANRVVIFDASWNPCHDCQAVCRVYLYGQQKSCYIYRLVTDNTMEKKIYDRQIGKQGISDRVVDELNPNNHMTRKQVDVLLEYEDKDPPEMNLETAKANTCDDLVLNSVLTKHYNWITKVPFNHDQLLADNKSQRLTMSEKRHAHEEYEMTKNKATTRPSSNAHMLDQSSYIAMPDPSKAQHEEATVHLNELSHQYMNAQSLRSLSGVVQPSYDSMIYDTRAHSVSLDCEQIPQPLQSHPNLVEPSYDKNMFGMYLGRHQTSESLPPHLSLVETKFDEIRYSRRAPSMSLGYDQIRQSRPSHLGAVDSRYGENMNGGRALFVSLDCEQTPQSLPPHSSDVEQTYDENRYSRAVPSMYLGCDQIRQSRPSDLGVVDSSYDQQLYDRKGLSVSLNSEQIQQSLRSHSSVVEPSYQNMFDRGAPSLDCEHIPPPLRSQSGVVDSNYDQKMFDRRVPSLDYEQLPQSLQSQSGLVEQSFDENRYSRTPLSMSPGCEQTSESRQSDLRVVRPRYNPQMNDRIAPSISLDCEQMPQSFSPHSRLIESSYDPNMYDMYLGSDQNPESLPSYLSGVENSYDQQIYDTRGLSVSLDGEQ